MDRTPARHTSGFGKEEALGASLGVIIRERLRQRGREDYKRVMA
jgi:hypothetical protein